MQAMSATFFGLPELGKVRQQGAAQDGTNAGGGAEPMFFRPPDRAPLDGVIEITINGRDAALQPADMAGDLSTDGRRGMLQAMSLGGQHIEELTAARHEGVQVLQHRIRQGTKIWVHPFGKQRDELSIKSVGLGELPGGCRDIDDPERG
ncbi:MAG TPA: hypothetical protein VM818_07770 [Vicinamibacterales bacterium]|nr:hypothetical protein [Vicinamibacterales bacterium]